MKYIKKASINSVGSFEPPSKIRILLLVQKPSSYISLAVDALKVANGIVKDSNEMVI